MQYLMLVRVDHELAGSEIVPVESWIEEAERRGARLHGGPLEEAETATTVRREAGTTLLADGPFTETKEIVAGYDLLELPDLEAAIDLATRHPVAAVGALEVREVWDDFVAEREAPQPPSAVDGTTYLFLHVPDAWRPGDSTEGADPTAWVRDVEDRGVTLGGWRLRDADPATSAVIRVRDGETLVSRGPFTETAEQIAGVDRIRVPDLDEAIALAAAHPTSGHGRIEVRPLLPA